MHPIVQKDILAILPKAIGALQQKDFVLLTELSNRTIHDASIYQDDDSITSAILMYALSKLAQRCCEAGIAYADIQNSLKKAYTELKSGKIDNYRMQMKSLFALVQKADNRMKLYVEEVLNKARVKKGSKLHEHGISIARTAEILGISQWELQSYIGKVFLKGVEEMKENVKKRLDNARQLL